MCKKFLSIIIGMVLVFSLSACGNSSKNSDGHNISGEWAMYDSNYMFAVEVDDFNGDVFSAGKYKFYLSAGRNNPSEKIFPAIFDIYIAEKVYNNFAEMKNEISQPQITVGGMDSESKVFEYDLIPGQYVYVVPNSDVAYEPSGFLSFEISE